MKSIDELALEASNRASELSTGSVDHMMHLINIFAELLLEEAARTCEDQDQEYAPYTGIPLMLNYQCAEAVRGMKPEKD